MALTINNFWGAETGGLEETIASTGSPSATSSTVRSGGYAYQLDSGDTIDISAFEAITDAGDDYVFGAAIRISSTTAATDIVAITFSANPNLSLTRVSGNYRLLDTNGSTILDVADATSGVTANTWHYIEIYFQQSDSASVEIFIDETSRGSASAQDLSDGAVFNWIKLTGNTAYFDDMYVLSGATASSDRLGPVEVYSYRSSLNSATPDTGDALDSGTWLGAQTIPFSATVGAEYTNTGAGSVNTDDVGGSAGTGGPNTDANITGSIVACKGVWRMERSGGGGSAHYGLMGNSVDGTTRSADFNPLTIAQNYFFVSESASIVPTSSEYGKIGFETTGGQDFECYDMLFQILHVPPAAATGSLVWQPNRLINNFLVR